MFLVLFEFTLFHHFLSFDAQENPLSRTVPRVVQAPLCEVGFVATLKAFFERPVQRPGPLVAVLP